MVRGGELEAYDLPSFNGSVSQQELFGQPTLNLWELQNHQRRQMWNWSRLPQQANQETKSGPNPTPSRDHTDQGTGIMVPLAAVEAGQGLKLCKVSTKDVLVLTLLSALCYAWCHPARVFLVTWLKDNLRNRPLTVGCKGRLQWPLAQDERLRPTIILTLKVGRVRRSVQKAPLLLW